MYSMNIRITDSLSEQQEISSPSGQYLEMTETEFKLNGVKIKKN